MKMGHGHKFLFINKQGIPMMMVVCSLVNLFQKAAFFPCSAQSPFHKKNNLSKVLGSSVIIDHVNLVWER